MSKHRITEIDAARRCGVCSVCGQTWLKRRVRRGRVQWSCGRLHGSYSRPRYRGLIEVFGLDCARCGFVGEHPDQIDIHHIDGDHTNDDLRNLTRLCANCHRAVHAYERTGAADPVQWRIPR